MFGSFLGCEVTSVAEDAGGSFAVAEASWLVAAVVSG